MRLRIAPAVGVGMTALALATTVTVPAGAQGDRLAPAHSASTASLAKTHPAAGTTCYSQLDNDNGVGIVSQNFTHVDDAYDSQAADDFKLTRDCKVTGVQVSGVYFEGKGPADSVNVWIYRSAQHEPGKVVSVQRKLDYRDRSGSGNLRITLASPVALSPGTYWVSVQANMAYTAGGEWGWNTNNTVRGTGAKWHNPSDGFGTGCTKYQNLKKCLADSEGGDLSFAILR